MDSNKCLCGILFSLIMCYDNFKIFYALEEYDMRLNNLAAKILIGIMILTALSVAPVQPLIVKAKTINVVSVSISVGEKQKLDFHEKDNIKKWISKDKSIAKVNKKGVVTGIKPGETTIIAKGKNNKYTWSVTVKDGSAEVSLDELAKALPDQGKYISGNVMDLEGYLNACGANSVSTGYEMDPTKTEMVKASFGDWKLDITTTAYEQGMTYIFISKGSEKSVNGMSVEAGRYTVNLSSGQTWDVSSNQMTDILPKLLGYIKAYPTGEMPNGYEELHLIAITQ